MTELVDRATARISNTKMTDRGLVVTALAARTGTQTYLASQVGLIGDDEVEVYRPEEAVFNRDSVEGFAGAPVTIDHPNEPVTPKNWLDLAKGTVSQDIVRDGEHIRVTFTVNDATAIAAIEDGKREISMGYTTPIKHEDGVTPDGTKYQAVQTGPIKINHLAIVDKARGGEALRIGDGAGEPQRATSKEAKMPDTLKTMMVDGVSIQVTDQAAQIITKLQDEAVKRQEAHDAETKKLNDELTEAKKTVETRDGELAAVKKQRSDATSPKALADMASKRRKTMDVGKKSGMKEEEMEEMDDAAIQRAVVSKDLGDEVAKGMSDEAITGAFASIAKRGVDRRYDDNLGGGVKVADTSDPWAFIDADKKKGA